MANYEFVEFLPEKLKLEPDPQVKCVKVNTIMRVDF